MGNNSVNRSSALCAIPISEPHSLPLVSRLAQREPQFAPQSEAMQPTPPRSPIWASWSAISGACSGVCQLNPAGRSSATSWSPTSFQSGLSASIRAFASACFFAACSSATLSSSAVAVQPILLRLSWQPLLQLWQRLQPGPRPALRTTLRDGDWSSEKRMPTVRLPSVHCTTAAEAEHEAKQAKVHLDASEGGTLEGNF